MPPTDVSIADWLEVIRAEDQEIRTLDPVTAQVPELWGSDALTTDELVRIFETEWLKHARRDAYMPAN